MLIKNKHSGKEENVNLGDILYTYYEGLDRNNRKVQKTWSFRCQGILEKTDGHYILGPGDVLYQLGVDCFKTIYESLNIGYNHDMVRRTRKDPRMQYKFVILTDEEKIRL